MMADSAARPDILPSSGGGAARLGAELQAARGRLGWELPQLAASLRIRQSYLEAIEGGRVKELPGGTYAQGFVRTYASALGLPGEEMAKRYRAEAMSVGDKPALRFPAPVPQRGVPAGALMLLGLVILGVAYVGYYQVTERRAGKVEIVPPIPDRLAASVPAASAPSPQVASLLPATAPPSPKPVVVAPSAVVTAPPAGGGVVAQGVAAVAPPTVPAPQGLVVPAPTGTAPVTTAGHAAVGAPAPAPAGVAASVPGGAAAVPPAAGVGRIVLKASADIWVTIKQKGGPALLNKMMHAGDSFAVPADKADLTLTTGNAGGTQIEVDGAAIPVSLGGSGMVRRDLPLDADALKAGKLPAAPAKVKVLLKPVVEE